MQENIEFIHITKCAGTSVRKTLGIEKMGHNPVRTNNDINEDTFVFSFVRNPFDRFASFYKWHWRSNIMNVRGNSISFADWIDYTIVQETRPYHYNPTYWKPCHWWLSDEKGNLRADFVGKVENIKEDWEKLCEKLGINLILEKHNTTEKVEIETKYTPRMKEYVLSKYKKDFQTWYPNLIP